MLGLLRNNCQFITQVGVSERLCIAFSCKQIQIKLPLTEFHFDGLDWVSNNPVQNKVLFRVNIAWIEEEMTRVAAKIVEQVSDIYGS